MKKFIVIVFIISFVFSTMNPAEANAAKQLVNSNLSCDKLNESQLELIGDFYMEQMHPGQAHELMDNMMGGEGSESLKQVHINIAKRLYCNENVYVGYGIMGSGMMRFGGNMVSYPYSGMMGGYGGFDWILSLLFWILAFAALVLLILWLYKNISGKGTASGLEILKSRYAKGEISKKEYQDMKKELGS